MKQYLTLEMTLDEITNNPDKYLTKNDWLKYMSNLSHDIWNDALLTKISNGGDISNSDTAFAESHAMLMNIAELVWTINREP